MARRRARAGAMQLAAALLACSLRLTAAHVYREFDTQMVKGLAKSHPLQTAPGTVGLPNGCNTYGERYGRYANFSALKGAEWDPNAENPDSDEVVLVRFHVGGRLPWDLLLHLRALMAEVAASGKHVYLLHEDRPRHEGPSGGTPHKLRAGIPPELRPISHAYSPEALAALYPAASEAQQSHLPFVFFLNSFPAYRFAWILDHDVRYTGHSWGEFLNAALHHASLAVQAGPGRGSGSSSGRSGSSSSGSSGSGSSVSSRRLMAVDSSDTEVGTLSRSDASSSSSGGSSSSSSGGGNADGRRQLAATVLQRWASREEEDDADDRMEDFKELFIETKGKSKVGSALGNTLGMLFGRKTGDAKAADSGSSGGSGGKGSSGKAAAKGGEAETLQSFSEEQRSRPPQPGPSKSALRKAESEGAHQVWRGWQPYKPEHAESLRREAADGGLTLDQMLALERKGRSANASDPRHSGGDGLPDLLLFGIGLEDLGDAEPQEKEHWSLSSLHRADLHAMGLSRRMAAALHSAATKGKGGAAEEVVPSLAIEQKLDVVTLPISSWGGDTHSCCSDAAKRYYKGWRESKDCRHYALLHPVRISRADTDLSEGP